MNHEGF